jgi:hypothetical protein
MKIAKNNGVKSSGKGEETRFLPSKKGENK